MLYTIWGDLGEYDEESIVCEENYRRIVEEFEEILEKGDAALIFVAPYRGEVVAPRVVIQPYIDFPEEFNMKQTIDEIEKKLFEHNLLENGKIKRLYLLVQLSGAVS